MSEKELIKCTIERRCSDFLPRDIYEGWMWPKIQSRLIKFLGAQDFEDMLNKLNIKIRWLTAKYNGPALPDGSYDRIASPHSVYSLNSSIWGIVPSLMKEHGLSSKGHPLSNVQSIYEIENYKWPSPENFDYKTLKVNSEKMKNNFLIVGGFSPIFYLISDLFGMEEILLYFMLKEKQKLIVSVLEKIYNFYSKYYENIYNSCGNLIDGIAFGDDFSSQENMLLSPEHWRKLFKPLWKKLFADAKKRGYKVIFHSCGAVSKVIPDLIEIGLDLLYSIQPKATDMSLSFLKKQFGKDISFYGGIDVQELLPFGSESDIKNEVEKNKKIFSESGGLILSTSHVIMEDVPVENICALYGCV